MRKPFSELIGFSFVFFRNLAPIVSHMAPKEFHGRLTRFFKSSQPEYIMNVCSKEKMSVKRSICRRTFLKKAQRRASLPGPFRRVQKEFYSFSS
jgi:hypothetical protein